MNSIKFNMTILDCLLHGKFSSAGDLGTQLVLKESLCDATRASLMDSLSCDMPRCSKGSKLIFKDKKPIHVKSALKATRAIVDCMADADKKLFLRFSTKSLLSIYVSLVNIPYDDFIKSLKYYTAYPLALFLKNDPPPRPSNIEGSYPFPGNCKIKSWIKVRLFSKSHYTKNLQLFWSLLQGVKRACEFADDAFIVQTMEKHKSVLSNKDRTSTTSDGEGNFLNKRVDYFSKQFERFFKDFKPEGEAHITGDKRELDREFEISNSACWERTRSNGGARGEILDIVNDVREYTSNNPGSNNKSEKTLHSDLSSIIYRTLIQSTVGTILHRMVEVAPGVIEEIRGVRTPVFSELLAIQDKANRPNAMVAAILEPLKVRLITKGPAVEYFLAKSLQKSLFAYLRRFPQFELIGDPLRTDHLYRMVDREDAFNRFLQNSNQSNGGKKSMNFSHFVSGDYSAATDNLKITYTKLGLESALQNVREHDKEPYRTTLYEHVIHYPEKFGVESFTQQTGQLMGSPLSFPFLCVCNLIAYQRSLQKYTGTDKDIPFHLLPCLVNGDDILFRTNLNHYEIWKEEVKKIGFDLSIGKNYIHEKVLTINSTMFKYEYVILEGENYQDRSYHKFTKVDFCNFGLLSGTSKLGSSRGERREKAIDLCDAYTRSVGGAVNKPLAHAKFLSRNKEDLKKVTHRGRYNLFLPRVLGGLGLTPYEGIEYHVTRFQMCVARYIRENLDFSLVGFKNDGVSNSVGIRETNNKKRIHIGYGPFNEFERVLEDKTITVTNSEYLQDTVTKFFTKIGEKYDAQKLFPFRLKRKINCNVNVDQALFRVVCDYSF